MRKTIPFALLFFLCQLRVFAQLSLPFFDDFARYNNRLDATKWVPNSSVFVNNTFSNKPVTKNMATFNGFLADGRINNSNSLATEDIDTLTSQAINLAGRSASDSVYLSFYLQTGGIGNNPGTTARFILEFKDNNGAWVQAFMRSGQPAQPALPDFTRFAVAITDAKFFHSNFQFRFRTIGRSSLVRDTWNLDYVYLNSGQQKNNPFALEDVATTRPLRSILKNYTAMPAHQLSGFEASEISDSLTTDIQNLSNQPRADSLYAFAQVDGGPRVMLDAVSVALYVKPDPRARFPWAATPPASAFNNISGPTNITSSIVVKSREQNLFSQYNDTIYRVTPLQNYYAYDDGSAESVVSIEQGMTGQVAQKFTVNKPDMVEALSFYMPKVQNRKGTFVTFRIWDEGPDGNPAPSTHWSTSFLTPDIADLDTFITIPVDPPVPVSGTFYIGWGSSNQYFFSIGLDRNETHRGNARYLPGGSSWRDYLPEGAIMLRAVMNNNIVGISEDQLAVNQVQVYPNPATSVVNIRGKFDSARLLSLTGQVLTEKKASGPDMQVQTSHLKPGMYLLQVMYKNLIQTHKLIIQPN